MTNTELFAHLKKTRDWIIKPPYYGVPWIVWFYALFSCCVLTQGGVFAGLLTGYDDHTRMTQVLNWVNGAGWYDRTIMRVNAPEGFTTIWSRLVDIPYAAMILLLQNFMGQRAAALATSFAIPLVELGVLFAAACYFARPLLGKQYARLIILFLMFTSVMNYKSFSVSGFHTGEVSHHSWYIILALVIFGAAGRMVLSARGSFSAVTLGAAAGFSLAVGIESFPLIAGAILMLAFVAWFYSRPALAQRAMQAMVFAGMTALILLPLHQPPEYLFNVSFAEPSILGPILVGFAVLFLIAEYLALLKFKRRKDISGVIILAVAAILAAILIWMYPEILEGPTAALSSEERELIFREHAESRTLFAAASGFIDYIGLVMPTVIAVIAGAIAIRTAPTRRRQALTFSYFGFAVLMGGMAEIYARFYHHAMTTASVWLTWAWKHIVANLKRNRNFALAAFGYFILLGPLWMLLLPSLNEDGGFTSTILLYPAKVQSFGDLCHMAEFADFLDHRYDKNTLILVPGADSSRMLYYTDLRIDFLNNYPSQNKFIDNRIFFGTQNVEIAREIARRHRVDLVAVCSVGGTSPPLKPGEEPMMFERLQMGQPPAWLKPVPMGIGGAYKLYEVDKAKLR